MDQLGKLLDRPKQYYNIDGVGELARLSHTPRVEDGGRRDKQFLSPRR